MIHLFMHMFHRGSCALQLILIVNRLIDYTYVQINTGPLQAPLNARFLGLDSTYSFHCGLQEKFSLFFDYFVDLAFYCVKIIRYAFSVFTFNGYTMSSACKQRCWGY